MALDALDERKNKELAFAEASLALRLRELGLSREAMEERVAREVEVWPAG